MAMFKLGTSCFRICCRDFHWLDSCGMIEVKDMQYGDRVHNKFHEGYIEDISAARILRIVRDRFKRREAERLSRRAHLMNLSQLRIGSFQRPGFESWEGCIECMEFAKINYPTPRAPLVMSLYERVLTCQVVSKQDENTS